MHQLGQKGYITLLTLVFGVVFLALTAALTGFVSVQNKALQKKADREVALQTAEAGLDYYKWFLAHYPDDLQDGTGAAGPYVHTYSDPEGGDIGEFSLDVEGNNQCGSTMSIDITSTGSSVDDPSVKRTVFGRYARPSVADYSFIMNAAVWFGAEEGPLTGRFHSNGGIRMDAENLSVVTSGVEDWLCTASFGCSPDQTRNGIFGVGAGLNLWKYPVPQIDFAGITADLADMKARAIVSGLYFPIIPGDPDQRGYHLVFLPDGSVDVYKVSAVDRARGYNLEIWNWDWDYHDIAVETFDGNYTVPPGCPLIYAEGKVWLEGTVGAKITVAAADLETPSLDPDIIINDNIDYTVLDGSVGLTAIAEHSVLIPIGSPDDLLVRGIYIAQKGYFGRNYYPSTYSPYHLRNSFTMYGTIVSNLRVNWLWVNGSGTPISGYRTSVSSYDRKLADSPPVLTPFTSDDARYIIWRED